ncbi:hypothetical protein ACQ4PT_025742 [Festuca glaucescens]
MLGPEPGKLGGGRELSPSFDSFRFFPFQFQSPAWPHPSPLFLPPPLFQNISNHSPSPRSPSPPPFTRSHPRHRSPTGGHHPARRLAGSPIPHRAANRLPLLAMGSLAKDQQLHPCDSLLLELNVIWDEVGEPDTVRDKTLLELEQECLDAYRRKVDQANRCRAQLRQSIAEAEAELAGICSAIGEPPVHVRQSNQKLHGLREELNAIIPYLEEMRTKKVERWNQFVYVLEEIKKISSEIRPSDFVPFKTPVDQSDLSLRKLEELTKELESLQKEKADRVKQVMEHLNTLHSLCEVLDIDFKQTVHEVHPSLDEAEGSKNLSNTTIDRLASAVNRLREMKIQRMQKLQDFASTMLELWNLMDTPIEEQQVFQNVTCNIAASEHEITEPNTLSIDFLSYVEAEVLRLEQLKGTKMKDLVLKRNQNWKSTEDVHI